MIAHYDNVVHNKDAFFEKLLFSFNAKKVCFCFQLEKEREVSTPAGLNNAISMLETKKSNLESRIETLRSELKDLTKEKIEIDDKTEQFSQQIKILKSENDNQESTLAEDEKLLLEKLQVENFPKYNILII
jgi:peptidoglycan hydrolase CwlO-like protein